MLSDLESVKATICLVMKLLTAASHHSWLAPERSEVSYITQQQVPDKKKKKKKAAVEASTPTKPATSAEEPRGPAAQSQVPSEGGGRRPATPASDPIKVAKPGNGGRDGQGGAAAKCKPQASDLLDQMTARLSGSKFRCAPADTATPF